MLLISIYLLVAFVFFFLTLLIENQMYISRKEIFIMQGSCQRCFRGHNGPVTVLSDKLLGDENGKVFASGGEDSTVRLWSLRSTGKRGQHALKATLYGHEKPIVFMSVSGYISVFTH